MRRLVVSVTKQAVKENDLSSSVLSERDKASQVYGKEKSALKESVGELAPRMIIEALEKCGHNQVQAAKELGLNRQGLIKKIRRYGIRSQTVPQLSGFLL